ncbi:MAG: glycine-rich protein [Bacteroidales bacterium]|nr:glycine-rich protein [Lachnoclostridium sp.]MCM1384843.1 glycine-rich protein [Lachnoclostridium sp.]MCM1465808.1 glycine-rich protein [Bacteroidales bacterium]
MADFSQTFVYNGDGHSFTNQVFTAPSDGLYKLEAYGACGGSGLPSEDMGAAKEKPGGYGGGSHGYVLLKKGEQLYIVVGGTSYQGSFDGTYPIGYGGANGGGRSSGLFKNGMYYGNGGGATHIAKSIVGQGALADYLNQKGEILIVAGGGGGGGNGYNANLDESGGNGGAGGGANGENGTTGYYSWIGVDGSSGTGGSQTEGGISMGGSAGYNGSFGTGGYEDNHHGGCGGGGGWYGGGYSTARGLDEDLLGIGGAGGGSGYIGGVPTITYRGKEYLHQTIAGANSTGSHGWAKITLIQHNTPSVYFGDIPISKIFFGDKEVTDIKF